MGKFLAASANNGGWHNMIIFLKCDYCNKVCKNILGIKIHTKRSHKDKAEISFTSYGFQPSLNEKIRGGDIGVHHETRAS